MKKIRVLVFGATGIGKTSLCNTLAGRNRPTADGAKGVTAKSHQYAAFEHAGTKIELVDTVGLHESSFGTVPADKAVLQLIELLKSAKSGFSLLIHVTRASRITKDFEDDHAFFVEKLTQQKIPVLLVATGCENSSPMQDWVEQNQDAFEPFHHQKIVASCFASGGPLEAHFAPLRAQSKKTVLAAILECSLDDPVLLYGKGTGTTFSQALARIWNGFVEIVGLPKKYRQDLNESAYEMLKRLGVPEKLAQMAIQHIPDLVEEAANKLPIPGSGKVARKVAQMIIKAVRPKEA